jgi:DNA polymerase
MREPSSQASLVRLLDWYRSVGVDEAVAEAPIDWLERGEQAPGTGFALAGKAQTVPAAAGAKAEFGVARPARLFPTASPDAALTEARAAARSAATLEELRSALVRFEGCALKATAKNLCFYRGAPAARLMLIGEAPGRDEDLEGKPFVGRAGQLLDKMLAAIELGEVDVHITNIVYWRPPGNRTPTPQEAQVCRPFLERQIELVGPEFIVLLGGAAAKHVLDVADGIMRLRGRWRQIEVGGRTFKAIATLHPAYLLRTPAHKRLAWRDLLAVRAALDGIV